MCGDVYMQGDAAAVAIMLEADITLARQVRYWEAQSLVEKA